MADEKACGVIIYKNENNTRKYVIIRGVGIYQGYYGFPKGHMEPGETEQETAIREVKEETGLDVVLYDDFQTVDEHPLAREGRPNDRKTNVYFLAEYRGQEFVMQKSEVSEIVWMDYEEAMKCMQYEESRRELTEAEEYLQNKDTDNHVDERDYRLLERDRYTFLVLRRIIGSECRLLLTDHERLIICFTGEPYPVWIWTSDDASDEEYEKAYLIAKENGLLDGEHSFNVKYGLAEYFINRAANDNLTLKIKMNMFAYDCQNPIPPKSDVDGSIHKCTEQDIDDLVDFLALFHEEVEVDKKSIAEYRQDAENYARTGRLYFWVNDQGRKIASCQYAPTGDMASINLVYTQKAYRRKHYAENLVYQVTKIVQDEGCTPMLYTNADYVASNACYEKIGYVLRGKLCTVG